MSLQTPPLQQAVGSLLDLRIETRDNIKMYPDNGPPQRPSRTFAIPLAAAARQFPLAHPAVASVVTLMRSTGEVAQNIDLMRVEIAHESGHALQRANLLLDAAAVPQ